MLELCLRIVTENTEKWNINSSSVPVRAPHAFKKKKKKRDKKKKKKRNQINELSAHKSNKHVIV